MRLINSSFLLDEGNGDFRQFRFLKNPDRSIETLESGRIQVEIDPRLLELYKSNQWALLKKTERDVLTSPVARALYSYYRTHNNRPHALLSETVKGLVGRSGMQKNKWLTLLRISLAELCVATGWDVCELAITDSGTEKIIVVKRACEKRPNCKLSTNKNRNEYDNDCGI